MELVLLVSIQPVLAYYHPYALGEPLQPVGVADP